MARKSTSKSAAKPTTKKAPIPPPAVVEPAEDSNTLDSSDEESDPDDDGVDEEGMTRLMELLGDDGLDEFSSAQLNALNEDEDEEDGSEDGESASDSNQEAVAKEGADEDKSDGEEANADENDASEAEEDVVALDDLSDASVDEDFVPRQKIVINNASAMQRIRETFKLDPSLDWTETLSVTYTESLNTQDPDDDLQRELAFYKQALHGAEQARTLASKHGLPFTRPSDYYAEMVKSDAHMERVRQKLIDETAGIKKSEAAKKQRELKKFGKQVQVEKLKERAKSKKDMEERLKTLKRKRGGVDVDNAQDPDSAFDVAVEDAIAERPSSASSNKRPKMARNARDSKFGFGGKNRRDKQNTRESTNDFSAGPSRGKGQGKFGSGKKGAGGAGKGGPKRLGKSRRAAGRS